MHICICVYMYICICIYTYTTQDGCNTYVISKTMCPPSGHHNAFVETHALGHMFLIKRTLCAHNNM